jgi:hypothetical protein
MWSRALGAFQQAAEKEIKGGQHGKSGGRTRSKGV